MQNGQTITIITKNFGTETINTETYNPLRASSNSSIFKAIEHLWNDWFTHNTQPGAPMAKDLEGMYYGECDQPAIYTKRGAIIQAIEDMIELAKETGKTRITSRDLIIMDLEAAWS